MKKFTIILGMIFPLILFSQTKADLPIFNDFSLYTGANIGESYTGWAEGNGWGNPQTGESGWYLSNVLFDKAAGVSLNDVTHQEWLITPEFYCTSSTRLIFQAALTRFYDDPAQGHLGFDDSVSVMISVNNSDYFAVFSFTMVNNLTNKMKPYLIDLSQFSNKNIRIAFFATDGTEPTGLAAFHIDDIAIFNAKPIDAYAVAVEGINSLTCMTAQTPVKIRLLNSGTTTLYSIPFFIKSRGPVNQNIYQVFQAPLLPGGWIDFDAVNLDLSINGTYKIWSEIALESDSVEWNNISKNIVAENKPAKSLPLPTMDFTDYYNTNLYQLYEWDEARGKGSPEAFIDTDWQGEFFSGSRAASVYYVNLGTEDWLVGPVIHCTENSIVEFKAGIRPEIGSSMGSDDKLHVMVSPDCGTSWVSAGSIGQSNNLDTIYKTITVSLSAYAGHDIRIALYATTGNTANYEKYLLFIDDVKVINKFQNDIGIENLLSPVSSCSFGAAENITVSFSNAGFNAMQNITFGYIIDNLSPVTQVYSQTIQPGNTVLFTFGQTANMLSSNVHHITVFCSHNSDQNQSNDTLHLVLKTTSFNFAELGNYTNSFEPNNDMNGWQVLNANNDEKTWVLLNDPQYAYEGNYSYFYSSNNTTVNSNDWLFSPCFYLEQGVPYRISFYYRNRATAYPEKLRLKLGNSASPAAMQQMIVDLGAITNGNYLKSQTTFNVSATGSYYFGWQAYGDPDMFAMHIDNIELYPVYETDLAVTSVRVPRKKDQQCQLIASDTIKIDLLNQGTQPVNQVQVYVTIDHNQPVVMNYQTNIQPLAISTLFFDQGISLDPMVDHSVGVFAQVAADAAEVNNYYTINKLSLYNYSTGFESFEPNMFTQQSVAGINTWQIIDDHSIAHTGNCAYGIRTDGAAGNTSNNDWLISECIYLHSNRCYKLSFYYRSRYSTENLKIYIGESQNIAGLNLMYDLGSFNSNNYLKSEYVFSVANSGVYYIAWQTEGPTSGRYYVYIDDVEVYEVTQQPNAQFQSEIFYKEVVFTNQSENSVSYQWDFGDGTYSDEISPSHIYAQPGDYYVTLIALNECGSDTMQTVIPIRFTIECDFDYLTLSDTLVAWSLHAATASLWNFDDGSFSYGDTVVHIYTQTGIYNVELTSFSPFGTTAVTKQIEIIFGKVNDRINENKITVYPVPASEVVIVKSVWPVDEIQIFTVHGQKVAHIHCDSQAVVGVDVTQWMRGIYIMKVKSAEKYQYFKIIKE